MLNRKLELKVQKSIQITPHNVKQFIQNIEREFNKKSVSYGEETLHSLCIFLSGRMFYETGQINEFDCSFEINTQNFHQMVENTHRFLARHVALKKTLVQNVFAKVIGFRNYDTALPYLHKINKVHTSAGLKLVRAVSAIDLFEEIEKSAFKVNGMVEIAYTFRHFAGGQHLLFSDLNSLVAGFLGWGDDVKLNRVTSPDTGDIQWRADFSARLMRDLGVGDASDHIICDYIPVNEIEDCANEDVISYFLNELRYMEYLPFYIFHGSESITGELDELLFDYDLCPDSNHHLNANKFITLANKALQYAKRPASEVNSAVNQPEYLKFSHVLDKISWPEEIDDNRA